MNPKIKSTDMKLLLLQLCFNLQCLTGITFCDGSDVIRVVVGEGSDVILPCSLGNNENIESKVFDWKKDGQEEVFYYDGGIRYDTGHPGQDEKFKGRVSHFLDELKHGNASIIIRNTKVDDSGNYTCDFPRLQPERKVFHIELVVGSDVIRVVVKEDSDVILNCSLGNNENITSKVFDWKKDGQKEVFMYDAGRHYNNSRPGQDEQFKGRVFHFQDELKHGNASIIIRNTTLADSGDYTCVFPRLQPERKIFHIELVVGAILKDRSKERKGASKPSVTILNETKDWSLLQCVVRGASPKPHLQWKDSAGNNLAEETPVSKRDSYDIILNTTVIKTDRYRCVVTQEEINHQTEAEIHVYINGAASKPCVTILDQTKDWSLLQCEVYGASPEPHLQWKDSAGNILPVKEPQVSERGGSYDVILQTTVTKTDRYRCVVTQEEINHQTEAETYVHMNVSESPTGWIVAAVFGTLFVLLLLAVLYNKGYIKLNSKKGSGSPTTTEAVHLNS